jgi:hypothetical protein
MNRFFEEFNGKLRIVKNEDPEINITPYTYLWNNSNKNLVTNYKNFVSIHPDLWFQELLPTLSKFDYIQELPTIEIYKLIDNNIISTLLTVSDFRFNSVEDIEDYLENTKKEFKYTSLYSINKFIIISDDLKSNKIIWDLKISEFNIDRNIQRDKKLDQILNI